MRSFLQSLDLYKSIILVSVLLLPVVGGWAWWLQGELERADSALHEATRRGGDLEEIGKFQKAIEEQRRSSATRADVVDNPQVYFDKCIRLADADGAMKRTDYAIERQGTEAAGRTAEDTIVSIDFRRDNKPLPLSRDFLLAVLFNCEASSPVWKLRSLHIRNADLGRTSRYLRSGQAPPPELGDSWEVLELRFASRQPSEGRR